jgi:uncharacterized membrane protein YphA (DoxX/SURF4 family)
MTLLPQGVMFLFGTASIAGIGVLAILFGLLLTLGFRTRIAGILTCFGIALAMLFGFPSHAPSLLDAPLPALLTEALCIGIVTIGPGAFSVDSRLFGRKEILVSYRPPSGG